jgi:hypothetical protein
MGSSKTDDGLEKQEGITIPLRRHGGIEAIGIAPTMIEFSTSGSRRRDDGTIECRCSKCGVYFNADEPHTDEMCALAQIMNE